MHSRINCERVVNMLEIAGLRAFESDSRRQVYCGGGDCVEEVVGETVCDALRLRRAIRTCDEADTLPVMLSFWN